MTITLLDLYNTAATQEWSMYDNDATSQEEFENSLVISLNKAIQEILYSYPFNFRERTHIIFTVPKIDSYDLPSGIILKNSNNEYMVKIGLEALKFIKNPNDISVKFGLPKEFSIKNNKLILNPIPTEKLIITIEYITLAIGENSEGDEIFSLKNDTDIVNIPVHLEEIFQNAVISRAMLNSIASESDENYSAYKKQSEIYYRQLVKYSKGVGQDKIVKL